MGDRTVAACAVTGSAAPSTPLVPEAAATPSSEIDGSTTAPAGAVGSDTTSSSPATETSVIPIAPGGTEEAAGVPVCRTSSLSISLGRGEGTSSGTVYRPLVFTNTADAVCRLRGFPGVSHVAGDDGHQVGRAGTWVGSRDAAVDLEPGASAHSLISVTNADLVDRDVCRPTEVRGFRVYPPGSDSAAYVPSPGISCSAEIATIRVRTILPGRGDLSGETGVAGAGPHHDVAAGGAR